MNDKRAKRLRRLGGRKGTPTFVVNGKLVSGYLPFEKFQPVIEKALQDVEGDQ